MAEEPKSRMVQCTRCRNKHAESDRIDVPSKQPYVSTESACPRCRGRTFYKLDTSGNPERHLRPLSEQQV
jgi:DNA-directed RNA polymerase subunit RPC12/RpoP